MRIPLKPTQKVVPIPLAHRLLIAMTDRERELFFDNSTNTRRPLPKPIRGVLK